jgi:Fur family ferric uptake transcriptional regulator
MNLVENIKEKGYRLTPKRKWILQIIEENGPLAVDQIFIKVRERGQVNLSTVYRNINILLGMGLIRKVYVSEGHADQYEIVRRTCEHSVECVHCGATVVFSGCLFNQMIQTIEAQTDFQVNQHRLEIYGVCPKCQKKNSECT